MNIGIVTDFYFPWVGGPSTVVRNLAVGLQDRGHCVSVLAPSPMKHPFTENEGSVSIHRVRSVPVPFGYDVRVAPAPARSVRLWLDQVRPDVVHVHHPFPLSAVSVFLARARGIPVVATNHTVPECSLWGIRDSVLYRGASAGLAGWITFLLRRCQAVATPTQTAATALHSLGYTGEIVPISNGVDTVRFRIGPRSPALARRLGLDERPVVLYTGRLDAEKQMDVWLRAASLLARRMNVQFLVGGRGTDRPALEGLSSALGLDGRLQFFGYLSDDEYPAVYRLADVYCITSPVELQSISTLEAVASGLPVVGVRAGALPELIHHEENGYLAPPGDPSAVASCLEAILSASGLAGQMARRSRTIAEHHTLQSTIDRYEDVFVSVARAARGLPG